MDMMSIVMLMMGHDCNMVAYMDDPERAAENRRRGPRPFLIEHKPRLVRKY